MSRKVWIVALGCCLALASGWLWSVGSRPAFLQGRPAEGQNEADDSRHTNRLIQEKSPYLLLHAHNPVDWYPWGEEAFAKARQAQKPIFLSIGYYTCHWCHVMERESYSDPGIAEVLNRYFVAIKVDREERPDLDDLYISYVQATTGSAGWPLNLLLTPDLKPFYGGTYFPPDHLRTLLLRIADAWAKDRARILQTAGNAAQQLEELASVNAGGQNLQAPVLDKAYQQIKASYDPADGGFGPAPKFPRPVVFDFLLRYYAHTGQNDALEMTLHTLQQMARGGIHDVLGGGFHRYSTDAHWRVPHFEKMLYDQSQLAIAYTQAYQITHDRFYADTARDILDFTLREMHDQDGGFDSAEDADSLIAADKPEHGEGAYYVWTAKEIEQSLGRESARLFDFAYGVEPGGDVPAGQDPRSELSGKNVLFGRHTVAEAAKHFGISEDEVRARLAAAREKLVTVRAQRPHPPLDDKVITAWNGLMISALAQASEALEEPRYLAAADAAARFLQTKLYDSKPGTLRRRYRAGEAAVDGFLSDYAFLICGLLDLYEAGFDVRWLTWAVTLQEKQDQLFWDAKQGGYFDTGAADSSLLARMRKAYDGAEPAPNSSAAMNLVRLAQFTDRADWREKADKTFAAFGRALAEFPEQMPAMAAALDFHLARTRQILIAGNLDSPDARALLHLIHERFLPNKILLLADGGPGQQQLARWLPFVAGATRKQGHATAYICENFICKLPTADPAVAARLLDGKP